MNQQQIFVISLIGLAVSTAALIVLIPSLFSCGGHADAWVFGGLGVMAALFALGARRWRPSGSVGHDG